MNKRQKIALLIIAVVWVWIAFGGPNYWSKSPYTGTPLGSDGTDDQYYKELEQFEKLQKLGLERPDRVKVVEALKRVKALRKLDFSEPEFEWPEIHYYFYHFSQILRAWIALVVPGGITIYLLKTHKYSLL